MIAMEYQGVYSSCYKKEREKIYKDLSKILRTLGPKLEPISYAAVKHFASINTRNELYRVSDMDTLFRENLDKVPGETLYFAGWMCGRRGTLRIRKLALVNTLNGDQYIVFQETMEFSSRLSIVNIKTLERVQVKSSEEAAGYLMFIMRGLEVLPLLLNTKGTRLKKILKERLNGVG